MMDKFSLKTTTVLLFLSIAVGMLIGVSGYTFWYGRGYSYLSNNPETCINCHIMRDNFDSWSVSSHRNVTCNDCHLPHSLVGKYATKIEHGIRHSAAFTFENVQVIRITPKSLNHVEHNCIRCHEPMVSSILQEKQMSCTRCHSGVGHVF